MHVVAVESSTNSAFHPAPPGGARSHRVRARSRPCASGTYEAATGVEDELLGIGFGDRFEGCSGRLRVFRGRCTEYKKYPNRRESAVVSAAPRPSPRNAILHGKEGVDGSSPSEGSALARTSGLLHSGQLAPRRTWGGYGAVYGAFASRTHAELDAALESGVREGLGQVPT